MGFTGPAAGSCKRWLRVEIEGGLWTLTLVVLHYFDCACEGQQGQVQQCHDDKAEQSHYHFDHDDENKYASTIVTTMAVWKPFESACEANSSNATDASLELSSCMLLPVVVLLVPVPVPLIRYSRKQSHQSSVDIGDSETLNPNPKPPKPTAY